MSKTIRIDILQYTRVVETFYPDDFREAARIYRRHSQNENEYTRLTVGKRVYSTAQAERFFQPCWDMEEGGAFLVY